MALWQPSPRALDGFVGTPSYCKPTLYWHSLGSLRLRGSIGVGICAKFAWGDGLCETYGIHSVPTWILVYGIRSRGLVSTSHMQVAGLGTNIACMKKRKSTTSTREFFLNTPYIHTTYPKFKRTPHHWTCQPKNNNTQHIFHHSTRSQSHSDPKTK